MTTKHIPTRSGIYWASFSNEDGEVLETALLHVCLLSDQDPDDKSVQVRFVADPTYRDFHMADIGQPFVRPGHLIATANGPGWSRHNDVQIEWLGEAKPPRGAPKPVRGARPV